MIYSKRLQLIIVIFALLVSGCDTFFSRKHSSTQQIGTVSSVNVPKYFAILGPLSGAKVTINTVPDHKQIYETTTQVLHSSNKKLEWGSYNIGSFIVDINDSISKEQWIEISVTSGSDVDSNDDGFVDDTLSPLKGKMKALCQVKDLDSAYVIVNIFTTLGLKFYDDYNGTQDIKSYLDTFAASIFTESLDAHAGVDYRDLFAYIPNHTAKKYLKSVTLYERLLSYKVMQDLLENEDIIGLLKNDEDQDGFTLWQELLAGTSPTNIDSDGDGISDKEEIKQGLNPLLKDSDYDGIDDNDEVLYGTSATNPDTDEDYIPDGIEVRNATDPLNADEDGNGIVDGLDGDPFFKYQWYLKSLGNIVANTAHAATVIGDDLHILDVYHKVLGNRNGESTRVQVVDTGVELKHEDLDVDLADSFNAITKGHDPTATGGVTNDPVSPLESGHGTAVAGIIAAKTNNGVGIRGIVPRAKIAGSNWLEDQTLGELERVWYSQINDDKITVSNNSWGAYYLKDDGFERILALATSQLRKGKGRVYVFAAGNSREDYGNSNLSYLTNNPYVITVAALNAHDVYAAYSNPGSNILISAYGGGHYYESPTIMTTSLSGKSYYESELNGVKGAVTVDEDAKRDYTYAMNGTSAAAPMVSGVIALTLDACPSLSWRDIRWLIANSAIVVDKTDKTWVKNGAGLLFSTDYGYGKINPSKMIEMCRSNSFLPLPKMQHIQKSVTYSGVIIPDNNTSIVKKIILKKSLIIEWVGVTIDTPHPSAGDLEINVISPAGTKINLVKPNEITYAAYENGFRFSSVGFMDEKSDGVWSIEIIDRLDKDEGSLKGITLEVYGHDE